MNQPQRAPSVVQGTDKGSEPLSSKQTDRIQVIPIDLNNCVFRACASSWRVFWMIYELHLLDVGFCI